MTLHKYWRPLQFNQAQTGVIGPPRDANGAIHCGQVSATRTESDTLLRFIVDTYLGLRVPPHMGIDVVPAGWFALSDAQLTVGFDQTSTAAYPYFTQPDQEAILGTTSLTMRSLIDPKDQASSYVWYKTQDTFSFEGMRKGGGNPGEFGTVYCSLQWGTFDLVGQLPGYHMDFALFTRGRALFGSTSL